MDVFNWEQELKTGLPQGSVLNPLFFACYLPPSEQKFEQPQTNCRFYADVTVIFFVYEETLTQKFFSLLTHYRNGLRNQTKIR